MDESICAWNGRACTLEGMSATRVNQLLQVADALPQELREWLVAGLRAWQQGQDLEAALQLHEVASTMSYAERDDLIRVAVRTAPGASETAQMFYFLDVLTGTCEHPDPTGKQFLDILRRSRVRIPRTIRHLRRILQGRRSDSWRQRESIFDTW